ncbi:MAG: LON peptidase substrate-binding domain-containing protein [Limisphaera sp.]
MNANARFELFPILLDSVIEGTSEPGSAAAASGQGAEQDSRIPDTLPILPVRNTVLFPGLVAPLTIGRPSSKKLLEESLPHSKIIGIFTQKDATVEEPGQEDLYHVGVAARVLKLLRQSDDTLVIIVQALERIALKRVLVVAPFLRAEIEVLHSTTPPADDLEFIAAVEGLRDAALKLVELTLDPPDQAAAVLRNLRDPGQLADFMAGSLNLPVEQKQPLLEELDVARRVRAVLKHVAAQLEIARIQQKIQKDVSSAITDQQRRAFLREQVRAIQKELGEDEGGVEQQIEELRRRLQEAGAPEPVLQQAERELRRLQHLHPASPEYAVVVSYLETLAELPWNKLTEDNLDLDRAQKILDRDHFNLEKVKRRLIEYLAVRKLNPQGHGPILCFCGPPGVGKTSLGQSIADALGRKFARVSLGGVHDEAEIRGHRRTYIGSMPGRIIQEIRRAGPATRCSCWTKWTRSAWIGGGILPVPCWRCSIPGKTMPLWIITSTCRSTSPK